MPDTGIDIAVSKAEIVSAIEAATKEVFSTMLNAEVTSEEIRLPQDVNSTPASRIISLIGLAGPWAGTGSVSCGAEFACALASQFLMGHYETVDDEVLDTVAEITNMIIGNVKNVIEDKVGPMGLSTPTVIFGDNFQTRSAGAHDWTGVRFTCNGQEMCVMLCLAPSSQQSLKSGFQFPQMVRA